MSIHDQVLGYLMTLPLLGDEYGDRTVILKPDDAMAKESGIDRTLLTKTLFELQHAGRIDAGGHSAYGPIVTVFHVKSLRTTGE